MQVMEALSDTSTMRSRVIGKEDWIGGVVGI
jgi:hypothetical protein